MSSLLAAVSIASSMLAACAMSADLQPVKCHCMGLSSAPHASRSRSMLSKWFHNCNVQLGHTILTGTFLLTHSHVSIDCWLVSLDYLWEVSNCSSSNQFCPYLPWWRENDSISSLLDVIWFRLSKLTWKKEALVKQSPLSLSLLALIHVHMDMPVHLCTFLHVISACRMNCVWIWWSSHSLYVLKKPELFLSVAEFILNWLSQTKLGM